jgi:hypothetical protein
LQNQLCKIISPRLINCPAFKELDSGLVWSEVGKRNLKVCFLNASSCYAMLAGEFERDQ